ncbi:aminotransferase [Longispora fulva]|uniref:Selenocysteine lyase/cysteine desulfurase n=1 Tax=Longispora fulva TaxID=619741 RepID=A0A8J7KSB0_9ACTN|nr:aminotransferase class V-fold PLP-dependent enzyme [Longispora fulva]MBG6139422.1 selenocysteine lyase/cysteine desulfurase [Longispora fulva]GIG58921.1 aminotransferase [Longispora fulva]
MSALTATRADLSVLGADVTVKLADGTHVPYANFDYAATAPCASAAARAVNEILPHYASVHRGAGQLSQLCTKRYEEARETLREFVGCRPDDNLIFTRNTTDALNLLAHAVPAGTTVLAFAAEHHANLLPWKRTVRLPSPSSPSGAVTAVHSALRELRRTEADSPLLLSVTGASNVTGELWPIRELAAAAHLYGARICVDAAQLAPHRAVDIAELGVDYLVLSGHKLYAPFGAGVLAGRADWLDAAEPYLVGGGATAHVGDATHDVRWAAGAARHEAGTPNLLGAVSLAAVCTELALADRAEVEAEEEALTARLRSGLAAIDGVHDLNLFGPEHPRIGVVAFVVDGVPSSRVAARLATEFGIGVRDGLFCAHPLTRRLLGARAGRSAVGACSDAPRGVAHCGDENIPDVTAVRASLGLGSTIEQVDRLIYAVRSIA